MKKAFEKKYRDLRRKILDYMPKGQNKILRKAFWFGFEAHKDQTRRSGVPYFEHCIEAANILADLKMDITTISAGLLHDVVEDTGVTLSEVQKEFGEDIAHLVDGVTKIADLKFKKAELKQAENFRKMVMSMAKDIRVVMIKFADRLHNMRTLEFLPKKKQKWIAQETMDVYAPLAHRFGIASLGWQFEDLALKYLAPRKFSFLDKKIKDKWEDRVKHIEKMIKPISKEMEKLKIPGKIISRPKSYFSIYKKMQEQNIPFEEIYDLLAMRIITDKKEDCYATMGIVHTMYTPVADRFKDFIATPKSNGYQSLHTTVISPFGRMIEVQIRTKAMDYSAEMGIAAHWLYKEKEEDKQLNDQLVWVRQILDWNKENPDPDEFMQSFKFDLYKDEIFVFTPKGRLINLPSNATPVDFAFAVHTEIGLQCIGAKVNSRVVPLYTTLHNGDEVEILTSSKTNLQEYWTSFVVTSKARNQIDKWFRENRKIQYKKLGMEMLRKELRDHNQSFSEMDIEQLKQRSGYSNLDTLWQGLGTQIVSAEEIARRVFPKIYEDHKSSLLQRIPKILKKSQKQNSGESYIVIEKDYRFVIELSKCCRPIPGDKILGFTNKDKGVIVHRVKCKSIQKQFSANEHGVKVDWAQDLDGVFPASFQVVGADRKHLLRDMAFAISKLDINILGIHIEVQGIVAIIDITLEVKDIVWLKKAMDKLEKIRGIQKLKR